MTNNTSNTENNLISNNNATAPPKRNESDVYDRQIRLWGADAQAKMSQAKVLYIHVTGVSSEILKNLVLAGIRATLCDCRTMDQALESPSFFYNAEREYHHNQTKDASTSSSSSSSSTTAKKQKLLTVAEVVQPRVEELNPLLDGCDIIEKTVDQLTEEDVAPFRVVVASRITMKQACQLSEWVAQKYNGVFYHVDSFGLYGACAVDLGPNFAYRPEKGKELLEETTLKNHVPLSKVYYVPFQDATNRFHKKGPPTAYQLWRSILEYVQHSDSNQWPTETTAQDFVSRTRAWIQETSPSLIEEEIFSESSLKQIAQVAKAELAPVCSVLGGLVGNEIIKAISGKGEPANNTISFEAITCKAYIFLVQPKQE